MTRSKVLMLQLADAVRVAYGWKVKGLDLKIVVMSFRQNVAGPTAAVLSWVEDQPHQLFIDLLKLDTKTIRSCVHPWTSCGLEAERQLCEALSAVVRYLRDSVAFEIDWDSHSSPATFFLPAVLEEATAMK